MEAHHRGGEIVKRTALAKLIEARLAKPSLDDGSFCKLVDKLAELNGWIAKQRGQRTGRPNSQRQQMSQAHRRILKSEAEEKISKMTLDELYIAKTQEPMPGLSNDAWKRMLRVAIKKLQPQQPEQAQLMNSVSELG